MKMKRIKDMNDLIIRTRYFVKCGIWEGYLLYCGHVHNAKEYTFTFGGKVEDWKQNFNIVTPKTRLKVFNIIDNRKGESL